MKQPQSYEKSSRTSRQVNFKKKKNKFSFEDKFRDPVMLKSTVKHKNRMFDDNE